MEGQTLLPVRVEQLLQCSSYTALVRAIWVKGCATGGGRHVRQSGKVTLFVQPAMLSSRLALDKLFRSI